MLSGMLKKIDKILCFIEEVIITFGLFTSAIILFINVILRYFFKSGIVWAEEYTRYAIIWITFVGGGVAVRHGAHLRVSALLDSLKGNKKKTLSFIVYIITIAFTVFLFIWGTMLTLQIKSTNQLTPAMEIPTYLIYLAIPVGGLLMTIRSLQSLWVELKGGDGSKKISGKELA